MITTTQIQNLEAETILSRFASIEKALQQITKTIQPPTPADEYLTRDEVASLLKVSKVTVWHWSKPENGILNPLYIGNQVRYLKSEVLSAAYNAGKGAVKK